MEIQKVTDTAFAKYGKVMSDIPVERILKSDCRVSVSFRCQFASSPRCRSSPESHSGVSLPLVRSFWSGFLHIPAKSHDATSPGKHIPHRLVIRLE